MMIEDDSNNGKSDELNEKPKRGRPRKATDAEIEAEQEKYDGKMAAAGR